MSLRLLIDEDCQDKRLVKLLREWDSLAGNGTGCRSRSVAQPCDRPSDCGFLEGAGLVTIGRSHLQHSPLASWPGVMAIGARCKLKLRSCSLVN
ncbi:MAG: hypothetical protein EBE86_012305 [Hormoscilla sp. GUM202]|nr:hypothetical protein [Hormoscilla sp. GUM202]